MRRRAPCQPRRPASESAPARRDHLPRRASRRHRRSGDARRRRSDLLQFMPRVTDVAQAALRIPLEASPQQRAHVRRHAGRQGPEVGLAREDGGNRVRQCVSGKQLAPGQHLEQEHAERPDVSALVHRTAARLLGRHVSRGAENDARLRHPGRGRGWGIDGDRAARRIAPGLVPRRRLRQTEVQDLHDTVLAYLHVGGLQITVDDACLVRGLEGVGNLPGDGQRLVEGQAGRGPGRWIISSRVCPGTSSMTKARRSPDSSRPKICAMFG